MSKLTIEFNLPKGTILRSLGLAVAFYGALNPIHDDLQHPEGHGAQAGMMT